MAKVSQGARIDALTKSVDALNETVGTFHDALFGGITSDKPGLFTRVDRLEQIWGQLRWVIMLVAGALIPIVFNSCQQKLSEATATPTTWATAEPSVTPTATETASPVPTHTPSPTARPTPSIVEVTAWPAPIADRELSALANLCWVECRGMGEERASCCSSVSDTVFERMRQEKMSDGTILGTIDYGCDPDDTLCQFPAFVIYGCEGITHPCPFDDPAGVSRFRNIVALYLAGALEPACGGYLFYRLKYTIEPECVIRADGGQYLNFHNGG